MTTFGCCARLRSLDADMTSVPIGGPISNTQAWVLDEYLNPTLIGAVGELYLGGPGVARGYRQRPALTAERFIPNPMSDDSGGRLYRTGDLVKWLGDGRLEFLGRRDGQMKIRGYRVEAGEIETLLRQHVDVRDAVVVLHGSSRNSAKQLVAYITPEKPAKNIDVCELQDLLASRLPNYMVPSKLCVLEYLPLSPSGKVDRKALSEMAEEVRGNASAYRPPRTDMEKELILIWQEVLGVRTGRC